MWFDRRHRQKSLEIKSSRDDCSRHNKGVYRWIYQLLQNYIDRYFVAQFHKNESSLKTFMFKSVKHFNTWCFPLIATSSNETVNEMKCNLSILTLATGIRTAIEKNMHKTHANKQWQPQSVCRSRSSKVKYLIYNLRLPVDVWWIFQTILKCTETENDALKDIHYRTRFHTMKRQWTSNKSSLYSAYLMLILLCYHVCNSYHSKG